MKFLILMMNYRMNQKLFKIKCKMRIKIVINILLFFQKFNNIKTNFKNFLNKQRN